MSKIFRRAGMLITIQAPVFRQVPTYSRLIADIPTLLQYRVSNNNRTKRKDKTGFIPYKDEKPLPIFAPLVPNYSQLESLIGEEVLGKNNSC